MPPGSRGRGATAAVASTAVFVDPSLTHHVSPPLVTGWVDSFDGGCVLWSLRNRQVAGGEKRRPRQEERGECRWGAGGRPPRLLTSTTLFSPQAGKTALDYAKERGYSTVAKLIEAKQKAIMCVPPLVLPPALANQGDGGSPTSKPAARANAHLRFCEYPLALRLVDSSLVPRIRSPAATPSR